MAITREAVLRALGRRSRPFLSPKALMREVGGGRHERRALSRVLRELVQEGEIERVAGRYRLRRRDGLIEATLEEIDPEGVGRARSDDGRIFRVVGGAPARAGDRVLIEPVQGPEGPRAEVVRTLQGARTEYVGILSLESFGAVVTPYRDDQEWAIPVHPSELGGARDGDVVVVRPSRRRSRAGGRGGRVVEVLGPPGSPEADFRAVVWRHRLPVDFPPSVLDSVDELSPELDPAEVERRVDLRHRTFLTIDPATARDHDDAVHVQRLAGGATRLWVAIADVAHYVEEGSALDAEALRRGNSVYFPDRAIPMLPERLSGDLCSLREGVDRLVMVVELEVDARGDVTRRSFYPAVIRSRARLNYDAAAEVMEGRAAPRDVTREVAAQLRDLADVAQRLLRRRFAAGSIDFDLPEAEIVLGDDGHPVDIVEAPRSVAHRAIEESMLAANRAVAECLEAARVPALYRVHDPPSPDDMKALRELLEAFGLLSPSRSKELSPRDIARAIQRVSGRPEERLVNLVALRSMQRARYDAQNRGHFALAFPSYTHFTSPIRRYADLVVHRALKDVLANDARARTRAERRGERVQGIAARVSWCERVAMDAEREVVDLKKCAFMAKRLGEEYDGTITGVSRHGFYVTLDPFFVEGLVHVSKLDDYYVLDERSYALVARRKGSSFRLGDRVKICVDEVDMVKGWINFSLVGRLDERGRLTPPGETRSRRKRRGRAGRR